MIALGRQNWLFAGNLRAGQRAAATMSLVHSARMNAHDPYAYLKDLLERLPTQPASRISELLPHHWTPAAARLLQAFDYAIFSDGVCRQMAMKSGLPLTARE